jgi:hypothetical protein
VLPIGKATVWFDEFTTEYLTYSLAVSADATTLVMHGRPADDPLGPVRACVLRLSPDRGEAERLLVLPSGTFMDPLCAWPSPDGAYVLLSHVAAPTAEARDKYVLLNTTTGEYEWGVGTVDGSPGGSAVRPQAAWSPDGQRIAIVSAALERGTGEARPSSLGVTVLDSGDGQAVGVIESSELSAADPLDLWAMRLAWSTDGSTVLAQVGAEAVALDPSSGQATSVWTAGQATAGSECFVSPRRDAVAVEALPQGTPGSVHTLSVLPLVEEGRPVTWAPVELGEVFSTESPDRRTQWSEDGRHLVYMTGERPHTLKRWDQDWGTEIVLAERMSLVAVGTEFAWVTRRPGDDAGPNLFRVRLTDGVDTPLHVGDLAGVSPSDGDD